MKVTKRTVTCRVEVSGSEATAAEIETLIQDPRLLGHDFEVMQTPMGFSLWVEFGDDRNGAGDLLRRVDQLVADDSD